MTQRSFRVGVDIGGTFTDVVFLANGETIHVKKCSSTPDDYSRGILTGIGEMLAEIGGEPSEIVEVVHATTVATNAILEGKGARTSLVTTKGFGDVIEIGRLRMPELYNLNYEKPKPLVPRRRRHEVPERMAADGSVVLALDEESVAHTARAIVAEEAEAVAVSFLHAYANPAHERRVADLLRQALGPKVFVSCSSDVLPEIREYERTSTVAVNSYLGPIVHSYLRSLIDRLTAAGITAPLQIMQSSGGLMSAASAMEKPACIIESGPAAGVIAAAKIGAACGYDDIITIDMGGTTAKAAMVEGGEPARTTEYEVGAGINISSKLIKGGGHAVKMPFVDVSEIGAGGGSIVKVDAGGLIQVGPHSAGSVPGPVCYDTGGVDPTLTDAVAVLGYVNPDYIAGGAVRLNAQLAADALSRQIVGPSGLDLLPCAYGVFAIAAATMMRAVKAVSTYRGRDPRGFTLFAFGGNGPLVGVEIARLLDMKRVVVPPSSGVFSALGLLYSQTQHELIQTLYGPLDGFDPAELERAFASVEDRVHDSLVAEGYRPDDILTERQMDLRYAGQAYELTVAAAEAADGALDRAGTLERFHDEHQRTYGHRSPDNPVELVNLRVIGRSLSHAGRAYRAPPVSGRHVVAGFAPPTERMAYFGPGFGALATPVLSRADLIGRRLAGPLIVEEYDATCVVQPGWGAELDQHGNIVITPEAK